MRSNLRVGPAVPFLAFACWFEQKGAYRASSRRKSSAISLRYRNRSPSPSREYESEGSEEEESAEGGPATIQTLGKALVWTTIRSWRMVGPAQRGGSVYDRLCDRLNPAIKDILDCLRCGTETGSGLKFPCKSHGIGGCLKDNSSL